MRLANLVLYCCLLLMSCTCSLPQHISNGECTYHYKLLNLTDSVTLASQVIHIENEWYDVYLNLCNALGYLDDACDQQAQACILQKGVGRRYKPNVASSFSAQHVNGSVNVAMIAKTNAKCPHGTFQFRVVLDKSINAKNITSSNECFMVVTLPHPTVQFLDCGVVFNGFIIDMSPLRNVGERVFHLDDKTKLAMSFCSPSPSCKSLTTTVCELFDDSVSSIAITQRIIYNVKDNSLEIRATPFQGKRKVEIRINCNWTATIENFRKMPGNHKYSIDSKYGCVKHPSAIKVIDDENYDYDISALDRRNGWEVANISAPFSKLLINIVGPLEAPAKVCKDIYSQVYAEQKSGVALSYGSLSSGLIANTDNLQISFTHGSICPHNSSFYLSTNVKLVCSSSEEGPWLSSAINCTMDILWKSPQACPKGIAAFSSFSYEHIKERVLRIADLNCSVHNADTGHTYQLTTLISPTMYTVIGAKRRYYINICRNVQITPTNYLCKESPVCVEKMDEINIKHRFKRLGKVTNPIIEKNELLIHYDGGYCFEEQNTNNEFTIHFNCSKDNGMKLLRETPCHVDMQWNTPLACPQIRKRPRSVDCLVTDITNKLKLNLSKTDKSQQQFTVNLRNVNFTFALCSDFVLTSNEGTKIKTNRLLTYNSTGCHYSLTYKFDDKTTELINTFKVDFVCDIIANNLAHISTHSLFYNGHNASIQMLANANCDEMYNSCTREKQSTVHIVHEAKKDEITEIVPIPKDVYFNDTISMAIADNQSHTGIIVGVSVLSLVIILISTAIFFYKRQVACCSNLYHSDAVRLSPYSRDLSD